jgi:hypothetical protein
MKATREIDSCRNCVYWRETCEECHAGWCVAINKKRRSIEWCKLWRGR